MLLTDAVAECAQFCKRAGVLAQLPSVFVMHGVDDKVVVQMCNIGVRGYQHLMPRPRFFANAKPISCTCSAVTLSLGEKDCT